MNLLEAGHLSDLIPVTGKEGSRPRVPPSLGVGPPMPTLPTLNYQFPLIILHLTSLLKPELYRGSRREKAVDNVPLLSQLHLLQQSIYSPAPRTGAQEARLASGINRGHSLNQQRQGGRGTGQERMALGHLSQGLS
jgi:hypothetical protein